MATTKQALVKTLIECGANTAFTLPGFGITLSLDAFYEQRDKFRLVLTRGEQVAAVMAQVTGRLTGRPGVYMGQGPFASTTGGFGILEAYFAGSPMLVLTETSDYLGLGQYGVYQTMTGDYGAADVRMMMKSMTKSCTYADTPEDAVYGLQQAYKQASLPRMGPTAVILKTPIINKEVDENTRAKLYPAKGYLNYTPARPDAQAVSQLAAMINSAERPVIIVGNGAQNDKGRVAVARLAEKTGCAVVTSYNGKGVVDETAPYAAGMLGNWGAKNANQTLMQADLIVILGASMAPDYTKMRQASLIRPEDQKIVHVDVDPRNAGWVYPVALAITADLVDVCAALSEQVSGSDKAKRLAHIATIKKVNGYGVPPQSTPVAQGTVHLADLSRTMRHFLTENDMLTLDAGTNRIWMTSTLPIKHPGQLLVPGGIGGMGWGAPAAAAAKYVFPKKRITCITGDGGFAMTMNVMMTCVQENLPITVIVANNRGLGMVRDNMKKNRIAVDFNDVNFATIAEGMGCLGIRVDHPDQLGDAINTAHQSGRPAVIDMLVDESVSHISVSDYE